MKIMIPSRTGAYPQAYTTDRIAGFIIIQSESYEGFNNGAHWSVCAHALQILHEQNPSNFLVLVMNLQSIKIFLLSLFIIWIHFFQHNNSRLYRTTRIDRPPPSSAWPQLLPKQESSKLFVGLRLPLSHTYLRPIRVLLFGVIQFPLQKSSHSRFDFTKERRKDSAIE